VAAESPHAEQGWAVVSDDGLVLFVNLPRGQAAELAAAQSAAEKRVRELEAAAMELTDLLITCRAFVDDDDVRAAATRLRAAAHRLHERRQAGGRNTMTRFAPGDLATPARDPSPERGNDD
jgi:cell division septation protein DedD